MKTKNNEMDMCSGPLLKKMIVFAIPIMLTVLLQSLFNTADLIVVGKFGREGALAAVGATGAATNLFINLFMGISMGVSICIARYYGAKDNDALNKCVHTSIIISLIIGVGVGIAGVVLSKPLLALMDTPENIINDSALYMKIYFAGLPFTMLFNFCAAMLRAVGDSKRCLVYISTAGVINVVLNLVFVIIFDMNVAGVATATVIAQVYSALMSFRCLLNYDGCLHLDLKKLRVYKSQLVQVLKIGIPSGLQSTVFGFSNVIIQSGINSLGTVVVSGSTAAANLEGYVYLAQNSIANTVINFTGQNYGALRFDRIKRIMWLGIFLTSAIGIVLGTGVYAFSDILLGLYTDVPAEIDYGKMRILCISVPYFLCGIMEVFSALLRGMCKPTLAMIISVVGVCVVRIGWIYTVFAYVGTDWSLYLSYIVTWVATSIILAIEFAIVFKKEKQFAYTETATV